MKRRLLILALALVFVLSLTALAACKDDSLNKAQQYLEGMYLTENDPTFISGKGYDLIGSITLADGSTYDVAWSKNVDDTKVKITQADGKYHVEVTQDTAAYDYTLTATITNAKGATVTSLFECAVPAASGSNQGDNTGDNQGSNQGGNQGGSQGSTADDQSAELLAKAKEAIENLYKSNAVLTSGASYELTGEVTIGSNKFTVEWSANVDESHVKLTKGMDKYSVTVIKTSEVCNYVLTATIKDANNKSTAATFNGSVPATQSGAATETTLTIDLKGTTTRKSYAADKVVHEANGITVTNEKASSSTNCYNNTGTYAMRLYKGSTVKIECANMIKIVITCDDYVQKGDNGDTTYYSGMDGMTVEGATITRDGVVITITFATPTNSFTSTAMGSQTRFNSVEVTTSGSGTTSGGSTGGNTGGNTGDNTGDNTGGNSGTTTPDPTPSGTVKDEFLSKVVSAPQESTNYYLAMYYALPDKVYYAKAEISNYKISTDESASNAAIATIETTSGGFYLKLGGKYVTITTSTSGSKTYTNLSLETSATTVFTVGTSGALIGSIGSDTYYVGTYQNGTNTTLYSTMGASKASFLTADGNTIDGNQFPARLIPAGSSSSTPSGGGDSGGNTGGNTDPVTPPEITEGDKGSSTNPYTVAEAITAANALGSGAFSDTKVYAVGYIVNNPVFNSKFSSYEIYIADTKGGSSSLQVYSVTCTTVPYINDQIKVYGYLMNYKGTTPEFSGSTTEGQEHDFPTAVVQVVGEATISAETNSQATVTFSKTSGKNGDKVTFTVELTDSETYVLTSVKVNGQTVKANEGTYSVTIFGDMTVEVNTMLKSEAEKEQNVTIDFKTNYETYVKKESDVWSSSVYGQHTLTSEDLGVTDVDLDVVFTAAADQSSNKDASIKDMPIIASKQNAVYCTVSVNGKSIKNATFNLQEWTTKKKFVKVALQYTIDGDTWNDVDGVGYSGTSVKAISEISTELSTGDLPSNVIAVRLVIQANNSQNQQVGVSSVDLTLA